MAGNTSEKEIERYSFSLFITIFGLEGGYEKSSEKIESRFGQINLRLLGQSSKSTQLIAGYGVRKTENSEDDSEVTNQYVNSKLQLYFFKFFGVDGSYKKFFRNKDNLKRDQEGERAEYGVFLEYGFLRLYGRAFDDRTFITENGVRQKRAREGVDAGVKFFF